MYYIFILRFSTCHSIFLDGKKNKSFISKKGWITTGAFVF